MKGKELDFDLYDFGLLSLSQPVQLNEFVKIICIPLKDVPYMGGNLTASGWGRTVATDNRTSARLRAIDVQLKSSKKCPEYLLKVNSKIVVDPNTILCSTNNQKKGPHRGDSRGKTFRIGCM